MINISSWSLSRGHSKSTFVQFCHFFDPPSPPPLFVSVRFEAPSPLYVRFFFQNLRPPPSLKWTQGFFKNHLQNIKERTKHERRLLYFSFHFCIEILTKRLCKSYVYKTTKTQHIESYIQLCRYLVNNKRTKTQHIEIYIQLFPYLVNKVALWEPAENSISKWFENCKGDIL